jgi:hypothetical protein
MRKMSVRESKTKNQQRSKVAAWAHKGGPVTTHRVLERAGTQEKALALSGYGDPI